MKGALVAAFALNLFATLSCALHIVERDGPPRVVGMPIERRRASRPIASGALRRRQKSVGVTLDNFEVGSQAYSKPCVACSDHFTLRMVRFTLPM